MTWFGSRKSEKNTPPPPPDAVTASPRASTITRQPVGFETVLGTNASVMGEVRCQADMRIDGTLDGTLEIEGNLLVGETGKINADVHVKNISIAGAIRGDIFGKKVQLLRTARVWGNINATAITTEEGAFIDGKVVMIQHEAAKENFGLPAPKDPADENLADSDQEDELKAALDTDTDIPDDDDDEELEIVEGEPVTEDEP